MVPTLHSTTRRLRPKRAQGDGTQLGCTVTGEIVRLSELYAQLKTAGDVHAFSVYLATPDLDGVDVDLVPVGG